MRQRGPVPHRCVDFRRLRPSSETVDSIPPASGQENIFETAAEGRVIESGRLGAAPIDGRAVGVGRGRVNRGHSSTDPSVHFPNGSSSDKIKITSCFDNKQTSLLNPKKKNNNRRLVSQSTTSPAPSPSPSLSSPINTRPVNHCD